MLEPDLLHVAVAVLALVVFVLVLQRPSGLFTGGRGRIPKHFEVDDLTDDEVPERSREAMEYLEAKLGPLRFTRAGQPVRMKSLENPGHKLHLFPFVHLDEATFFVMAIDQHLVARNDSLLHIFTPLVNGRRVETSTLPALEMFATPVEVASFRLVLDAESIEELWSRHRRALTEHPRDDRTPVASVDWKAHAARAYEGWVQSAVRAQRLQLEANGRMYRVRARLKTNI